uniref:Calponin-homology (CH) domain-containing protein n=1 Tax=Clastoptera arizonana TaxID=38151 RepID=A0A1B6DUN4_9HEMI
MASVTDIEDFLQGPLVTWLRACLDNSERLTDYEDLADGVVIYEVLLLIDPEPMYHGVIPSLGNPLQRIRNFDCIIKNIKTLYEEELCQLVVLLPDSVRLGKEPESKAGLEDMQLLLLLLLGCAVQCPNKQRFIEHIKTLSVEAQHCIVHCIKQVTESQEIVLCGDHEKSLSQEQMFTHIQHLIKERDKYLQVWIGQEDRKCAGVVMGNERLNATTPSGGERGESQHLAVELADWKARLRKQRQELEEKSEALAETKEELEHNKILVAKLRNEMQDLKQQARASKAYRDEVDALRERAERCEKLEGEITRYRDKLCDMEFYKSRVEELRQDNRVLEETREMLEEQLARARKRGDHIIQLEASILQYKQTINDLVLERDANQEKLQQLYEENSQLTILSKSQLNNSAYESDHLEDTDTGSGDNSLSEQLTSNAQARALRLELENRRLASTVESLQEAALQHTNEQILELEKEKKKLSLQVDDLEENKRKLMQHNTELETSVKNAQRDTKKMQELLETLQHQLQIQSESLSRDKQRLERRVQELEASLDVAKAQADRLGELEDAKSKIASLERDVGKLKESLEAKSEMLEKLTCEVEMNSKEKLDLTKNLEEANIQIVRYHEREREFKDLESRYAIDHKTLSVLQKDLVAEKLNTQQLKSSLDKLGLPVDKLSDPDNALDTILSRPEILKMVRQRLSLDETTKCDLSHLNECNARLEVNISTLQSQISSLTSQLTALQLANSQLVAEKEEVIKELEKVQTDQVTLQALHEQLSVQYESQRNDKEFLKTTLRDLRIEHRNLKEANELLSSVNETLTADKDNLKDESKSLNNLRAEHSKLKDDFRSLFTSNEKLKKEYRALQEEYKSLRVESGKCKLSLTELNGELETRNDKITGLEVQVSKLTSQCEMLTQIKTSFEEDRRSLMEYVRQLLDQYHELLMHSLDDKEHYHAEEKMFRDKVNNLNRQKEKLEEKIMEHYFKLESCPAKKKSFGATLVKRMRKAGSELISKSRKSWHEDTARKGTDSDTSLEEVRSRQADGLSLGTPGTRRTVYYSGDENNSTTNDQDDSKSLPSETPRTSTPQHEPAGPPLLVYNRLTTVLGRNPTPPHSPALSQSSKKQSSNESISTDYDYYSYS